MSINKQNVLEGMFCQRALWLRKQQPQLAPNPSDNDRLIMERGIEVGHRARFNFPAGQLVTLGDDMRQQTQRAIAAGATTLFEATFEHAGTLIRTDILDQLPNGDWHLIEVKSNSGVKKEHYADAAVQLFVLRGVGLDVQRVSLMHLNKACMYPELGDLFVTVDVSAEVETALLTITPLAPTLPTVLQSPVEPTVPLGTHCKICDFQAHCWQHLDDKCVYGIPRLSGKKLATIQAMDIEHLDDLPDDFALATTQRSYVDQLYNPRTVIDRSAIHNALAELTYPLYFLDFEADAPFLPRFPHSHPHLRLPYQYSCHILQADGTLTHVDYLHTKECDPREPLLFSLCEVLGASGSIIVYFAQYEKGVLSELVELFPGWANEIEGIIGRIWDQYLIFKNHYSDPQFKGSNSLKSVLPALVPMLDYGELAIQNGTASVANWQRLTTMPVGAERDQLVNDLRRYCHLDTLAMVELHKVLSAL